MEMESGMKRQREKNIIVATINIPHIDPVANIYTIFCVTQRSRNPVIRIVRENDSLFLHTKGRGIMKTCRLYLKDGEKETEFNFQEGQNDLIIIDGLFKFFGIEFDIVDSAKKKLEIERMYRAFYGNKKESAHPEGSFEIAETNEFQEVELPNTPESKPLAINPGINIKSGVPHYRCTYKCTDCGNTGNRYIKKTDKYTNCHKCHKRLAVKPINEDLSHDEKFNYFTAGNK